MTAQDIEPLPRAESLELLRAWAGKYAADECCRQRDRAPAGRPAAGAVSWLAATWRSGSSRRASMSAWLRRKGLEALHFGERPSEEHSAAAAAQPGRR